MARHRRARCPLAAGRQPVGQRDDDRLEDARLTARRKRTSARRVSGCSRTRKPSRRCWRTSVPRYSSKRLLMRRRAATSRDHLRPISSWCQKITRPSLVDAARAGLPMSWRSTAHASGTSGAAPGRPASAGGGEEALAAELRRPPAHVGERLERVVEDVEVVVGVLLDAAQAVDLGQHRPRARRSGEVAQAAAARRAGRAGRRARARRARRSRRERPAAARAAASGPRRPAPGRTRAPGGRDARRAAGRRRARRRAEAQAAGGEVGEAAAAGRRCSSPSSGRASASTVKSRPAGRPRGAGAVAGSGGPPGGPPRRAATSTCRPPSTMRQAETSEKAKTAPPSRSASARANGSASPPRRGRRRRRGAEQLVAQAPPTSQPASPGPSGGERGPA